MFAENKVPKSLVDAVTKIMNGNDTKGVEATEYLSEMDNRTQSGDDNESRAYSPEAKASRKKEQQELLKKVSPRMREKLGLPEPEQGVSEGLRQTLRKVVPGYAKREIDKKMDAGKFGRTDVDKDANYYRYKKIQDKIKEKGVAEAYDQTDRDIKNADQRDGGRMTATHTVHINNKPWKTFASRNHAERVVDTLLDKGRDAHVSTHYEHVENPKIEETAGVTDYNPKSQGGTRKELLAKWHKTKDPKDAESARRAGASQSELKGDQYKLDRNHNGKLDGQDFKILRGQKSEEVDIQDDPLEKKVDTKVKTLDTLRGRVKIPASYDDATEHQSAKVKLKAEGKQPETDNVPFTPPQGTSSDNMYDSGWRKSSAVATDKSGAVHTPMSRAKHLAKHAMSRVKNEVLGKAPGNN